MDLDEPRELRLEGRAALNQLEHLVGTINDLVENRIEKNLKVISRILLVDLPTDHAVTLDEFVSMQEMKVRTESEIFVAKNLEVETAVEDDCGVGAVSH